MMMKSRSNVEREQGEKKPRSDRVGYPRRIFPEIRQQRAFPVKDDWRRAAQHHHSYAARDHP